MIEKIKNVLHSQKSVPYVFVLPFILYFSIFWIYPLFSGVTMSFQSIGFSTRTWVGLQNYEKLLKDKFFVQALLNSLEYMGLTLLLLIPFPLLYAVMMDSRLTRAKGLWKAMMYMPALTSVVISGMFFRMMFSEQPGSQMNQIMMWLGQSSVSWLKYRNTAWFVLLLLCSWRWTGVNMLYFLSGVKSIDGALYESAEIDGCSGVKKFFYVTLPLLKPTIVYVVTISVYAGLAMFLESYMLWDGNESPKNIGLTIVGYLYKRGIEQNNMGYAGAVAVVLLVITLTINMAQLIMTGTFRKERD